MKNMRSITIGALVAALCTAAVPSASAQVSIGRVEMDTESLCIVLSQPASFGVGSKDAGLGGKVAALQQLLKMQKHMTISATGYFGQTTKAAVMAYQKARGVPATGFVGPMTLAKIKADCVKGLGMPEGATISVRTDKQTYSRGETIKIITKMTNTTDKPLDISFSSGCQASYAIGTFDLMRGMACTQALSSATIDPKRSREWVMNHRTTQYKLDPGTYTVTGRIIGYGSATTTITITN